METIKCPNCGESALFISPGQEFAICSACGMEVPLPALNTAGAAGLSRANELLAHKEFEGAKTAYEQLLNMDPSDAVACWGRALAEYGIEYVSDPYTDEKIPTLHRLSKTSFGDYLYAKQAVKYARSSVAEDYYREQIDKINEIQRRSLVIAEKEEPYQIFLCYKRTEANESRTADSRLADDIYKELIRRGYKVFFAEKTLKAGEEYEPRIWAALNSASIMIAIATRPEFYEAIWVKNEWERYIEILDHGDGKGKKLIPMFQHMTHAALPPSLQNMPDYIEMDQVVNPKQELLKLVRNHFERNDDGRSTEQSGERIRRQAYRHNRQGTAEEATAENISERGFIALANEDFTSAETLFQRALAMDQKCAQAWYGMALYDLGIAGEDAIEKSGKELVENEYFQKAVNCATGSLLDRYMDLAKDSAEWKKKYDHRKATGETFEKTLKNIELQIEKGDFNTPAFKTYKEKGKEILEMQDIAENTLVKTKANGDRVNRGVPGSFLRGMIIFVGVVCLLSADTQPFALVAAVLYIPAWFYGRDFRRKKRALKKFRDSSLRKCDELREIAVSMVSDVTDVVNALFERNREDFLDVRREAAEKQETIEKCSNKIYDAINYLQEIVKSL